MNLGNLCHIPLPLLLCLVLPNLGDTSFVHFLLVTFLNLEAGVCFAVIMSGLAADPSDRPCHFGLTASANRPANLHFPGDDLAEDAAKKGNAGSKSGKRKKIVERDDILKSLEYSTEGLKGPSGLSSVLTNKFNGQ